MPDPDTEHGLKIQLATALRERDAEKAALARAVERERSWCKTAQSREKERDALRTALTDIVTLCMDVPATEDWRKAVGDRARLALHGPPAWERK